MMEKKKWVSSLSFGKWGRHGLRGLSRGRGEREKRLGLEILELEKREPERKGRKFLRETFEKRKEMRWFKLENP